jgi:HSP20 family molecular chaperone IbpA
MGEISGPEFRTSVTGAGFVIAASLAGLRREDLAIVVEGWTVRIRGKRADSPAPFEAAIHVPSSYSITAAQAACLNNELRITIPNQPFNYRLQ